ncbi:MAG: Maf family protein [Atopobiaceae bacterium]|jgi:septum formation protein|nr:Maf family protein [Atopobiaceae bacterium]
MILASASPRRAELLRAEGFQIEVHPAHIDESRHAHEPPVAYVERLAVEKAKAAHRDNREAAAGQTLIAADTIVWTDDGTTFGKPGNADEARRMLRRLSGAWHHVSTGVCLLVDGNPMPGCVAESSFYETTDVEFFELSDKEIAWYISTGEPFDKAGGYGIQGRGRRLVRGIQGDFYNVVGLPIAQLLRQIKRVQQSLEDPSRFWF